MKIAKVTGREILDSRGNPTTEAEVVLETASAAEAWRQAVHPRASTRHWSCGTKRLCATAERAWNRRCTTSATRSQSCWRDRKSLISRDRPADVSGGQHRGQVRLWRKRHSGGVYRLRQSGCPCAGRTAVSVFRGSVCRDHARAHDEHLKWRGARCQQRGRSGVHDHAGGCVQLFRGTALVCGGIPYAGIGAPAEPPGNGGGGRGRFCAGSRRRRGGDLPDSPRHRGRRLPAGTGLHAGAGCGCQ